MIKYNILIHAINGIWLGHINRTTLIAKELNKTKSVWNIVFVSDSNNPFIIESWWFCCEKLDYSIEDTLNWVPFEEYEQKSYLQINSIIEKYDINVIIHDTFFLKCLLQKRKDLKHFLVLRDSDLEYLSDIERYIPLFKKVFIPHIKAELWAEKLKFYNKFSHCLFSGYVVNKINPASNNKNNKIIVSPWGWWDYENTKDFFLFINKLLSINSQFLSQYEIKIILWKYSDALKKEIIFDKKFKILGFKENLASDLWSCKLFIWRAGYNTINELAYNQTKSIVFSVSRVYESQNARIDFFTNKLKLDFIKKWNYDLESDKEKIIELLNNTYKNYDLNKLFWWQEFIAKEIDKELNKKNFLVFKNIFLPKSENFIHKELTLFGSINPIILTLKLQNLEVFQNNLEILYKQWFNDLLNLDYPNIKNLELYSKFLKYIIYIVKKYDIKVIYTEFLFDAYFIYKIKSLVWDIKILSAARWKDIYSFLKNVKNKDFFTSLDEVFVRDYSMKNKAIEYNFKKVELIRSVLDLSEYSFKTKDFSKLNIIIWWRFIEKKWILELIDLIYLLSKENFVWKIWLVWDGELKEQIFTKISTLGLNDTIKYYWFLEHKEFLEALWSYNCFINYSKIWSDWDNEGTNNVISENILVGNLVFSTIVWWIWDIIDDWETWFSLIWQADKDLAKIKNSFLINNLWKIVKTWLKKVKNLFAFKNSIIKLENTIKNNL